ncbi:hypothetical protein [Phocaeicola sp.]|uniref:hypothetical protein n=1 Tax=Phocaeicola sp. TaxID=2773926 RepID=UPI00307C0D9B
MGDFLVLSAPVLRQIARYLPHHKSENASKTHPKSSHDKFKTASYNYLNQVMDELTDHMIKNKDYKASNFIYCYVLDSANVVVVGLLEYSPAKIEEFKRNVSDSPAIWFKPVHGEQPISILKENVEADRADIQLHLGIRNYTMYDMNLCISLNISHCFCRDDVHIVSTT